jgi:hypothetical protein
MRPRRHGATRVGGDSLRVAAMTGFRSLERDALLNSLQSDSLRVAAITSLRWLLSAAVFPSCISAATADDSGVDTAGAVPWLAARRGLRAQGAGAIVCASMRPGAAERGPGKAVEAAATPSLWSGTKPTGPLADWLGRRGE